MVPHVKICCISSLEEARLAVNAGASALGLVGPMPSGPGVIDDQLIREITRWAPPSTATFLLTSETGPEAILAHHARTCSSVLQLVDAPVPGTYKALRAAIPMVKLVQVIHVRDDNSVREAVAISSAVDALLLDSGNPDLTVKELGGTGRVHDWRLSRQIVVEAKCPVFLAGGLKPANVADAIAAVQPFGLDLCSGVRTEGKLDPAKLNAFFAAVRGHYSK